MGCGGVQELIAMGIVGCLRATVIVGKLRATMIDSRRVREGLDAKCVQGPGDRQLLYISGGRLCDEYPSSRGRRWATSFIVISLRPFFGRRKKRS
eukprot:6205299-Pleurochrysis_carterae.AAC.4